MLNKQQIDDELRKIFSAMTPPQISDLVKFIAELQETAWNSALENASQDCEAHMGMRGTGAWTILNAEAYRIRDMKTVKAKT
jgi:hypothetical protein